MRITKERGVLYMIYRGVRTEIKNSGPAEILRASREIDNARRTSSKVA